MPRTNKILIRSGTVAPTASDFAVGEPAFDKSAGKFYVKNAAGLMVEIGAVGGGGATEVYEYATTASFPATGAAATLYIATDYGRVYRWVDGTTKYVEVGAVSSYDSRWDLFLPSAPTGVAGTAGNQQVSLAWTAPTVSAQTPITSYTVQYSSNGGSTWTTWGTSPTTNSATITSLTNGTAYTFKVLATNAVGSSAYSSASSSVTPAGDAYWSSVSLLLHGDGTGATITDSSSSALTVTANGSVTQSTTQSKFGGKSIYFNQASNTYLSVADTAVLDFGTGAFTVEMWFYPTAFTVGGNATSLMAKNGNDNWANAWGFDMDGTNLNFYIGPSPTDAGGAHGMSANTAWYHIAATRDASNVCRLFVNGVQKGGGATVSTNLDNSNALIIGSRQIGGGYGARLLGGYLDDIRITKGTARYTSSFSVPTAAFSDG
jgi:hypothetical protein